MSDVIRIKCPSCSKVLKAPPGVRGKRVECSGCGTAFRVSAPRDDTSRTIPDALPPISGRATLTKRPSPNVVALGADDVEIVEDFANTGAPPPRPPARPAGVVVDDFEVVDGLDSFDDGGKSASSDGYQDFLDLPDGYEDGPTVRRPRKRRKGSKRPDSYTSVHDDQRDRHNNPYNSRTDDSPQSLEGQVWNGSVLGGLAAMIIAVVWFFGALAAGWFFPYTIILFFIGLVGFVRGLMD